MTPEFLEQLALIRDNLALWADEYRLWGIVHAIDSVLQQYGKRP